MIESGSTVKCTAVIGVTIAFNFEFINYVYGIIKGYQPELCRAYSTLRKADPCRKKCLFSVHGDYNVTLAYIVIIPLY